MDHNVVERSRNPLACHRFLQHWRGDVVVQANKQEKERHTTLLQSSGQSKSQAFFPARSSYHMVVGIYIVSASRPLLLASPSRIVPTIGSPLTSQVITTRTKSSVWLMNHVFPFSTQSSWGLWKSVTSSYSPLSRKSFGCRYGRRRFHVSG